MFKFCILRHGKVFLLKIKNVKKKILFIINPVSGSRDKKGMPALIREKLDSGLWESEIIFSDYQGHGTEMARKAVEEGFSSIVAVGGDGTVNEVGQELIDTDVVLGILPAGSGNGLARHLNIPMNTEKAIQVLNQEKTFFMDSCSVNDVPFFCTSGIGFDAHIGKMFATKTKRGFQTYVSTTVTEFFNYKPQEYTITVSGRKMRVKAFLITFANSAQYGNNAFISPKASISDGLIDVCVLKPFSKFSVLELGVRLFNRTMDKTRLLEVFNTEEVLIERDMPGAVHLDGEPFEMGTHLSVKIKPKSLKIFTGNNSLAS